MVEYRPIRKTAFMNYKHCPKQFWLFYNSDAYFNYGQQGGSPALIRGQYFHKVVDQFFKGFNLEHVASLNDKHISEYFGNRIPETNDDIMNDWLSFFVDYEENRFKNFRENNKLKFYLPWATELEVKLEGTIARTGHIDRIDQIADNEFQIVEFKTGKSYNMDKPDRVTSMNAEIGFYASILLGINKFPEGKLSSWKVINPTLKKVWVNDISKTTLTSVEKTFKNIVDRIITKDEFPPILSDLCLYCPFVKECMYDPKTLESIGIDLNILKGAEKTRRLFT